MKKKIAPTPKKKTIISYLTSKELQHFSDTEYNNLIREIFRINPMFFLQLLYDALMKKIGKRYGNEKRKDLEKFILEKQFITDIFKFNPPYFLKNLLRDLRQKMEKFYGIEKLVEIEKKIIEKTSLYDGEQIIYDFKGSVAQILPRLGGRSGVKIRGYNYVTNYRIIAIGKLTILETRGSGWGVLGIFGLIPGLIKEGKARSETKKAFTAQKELPCYGYNVPIKNLYDLKRRVGLFRVGYKVKIDSEVYKISIYFSALKREAEENIDTVYDILKKEEIS